MHWRRAPIDLAYVVKLVCESKDSLTGGILRTYITLYGVNSVLLLAAMCTRVYTRAPVCILSHMHAHMCARTDM